jgi:hypothetical protein
MMATDDKPRRGPDWPSSMRMPLLVAPRAAPAWETPERLRGSTHAHLRLGDPHGTWIGRGGQFIVWIIHPVRKAHRPDSHPPSQAPRRLTDGAPPARTESAAEL